MAGPAPYPAFLTYALHQPLAATARPAKIAHGPVASPDLPLYSEQLLHAWPAT